MADVRVAVDVGGTFTDVFVFNQATGDISVTKVSSVPANPAVGIINGVKKSGVPAADIRLFSHGTTVGTNALITRRLPPSSTGLPPK